MWSTTRGTDHPLRAEITPATVNDVTAGRAMPIEPGATSVFDKAYCDYGWWRRLDKAGCRFVTRAKSTMRLKIVAVLDLPGQAGDGFSVSGDEIGQLAAQDGSALPFAPPDREDRQRAQVDPGDQRSRCPRP